MDRATGIERVLHPLVLTFRSILYQLLFQHMIICGNSTAQRNLCPWGWELGENIDE